jgi:hypothetical protein
MGHEPKNPNDLSGEPGQLHNPRKLGAQRLASALEAASAAERWDIVAQLARELEARRLAAFIVSSLEVRRSGRARP